LGGVGGLSTMTPILRRFRKKMPSKREKMKKEQSSASRYVW
jgi:hypothetical protein